MIHSTKYPAPDFLSKEDFNDRLKLLPAHVYEQLPVTLNVSPEWWGRYLSQPHTMKYGVLMSLSEVLGVHPYILLVTYGLGAHSLTALECLSLKNSFELQPA
jgi:hypothetical protein